MTDSTLLQPSLTLLGFAVFTLVWLGLGANILKIARRTQHRPSFNRVLGFVHLGRFAGWALVGAATWSRDPWTGLLLMATRIPAVGLVAVTFVQRRRQRTGRGTLIAVLCGVTGALSLLCSALVWAPRGGTLTPRVLGVALPEASLLDYALNGLVVACFAVQIFYALPKQILEARTKPLGNLRWFQLALLANYAFALVYSSVVQEALVREVMRLAYGAVTLEQALLVVQIERAVRRRRCRPQSA